MTATASINLFGKRLHTESEGQPEKVIPNIIKPMKEDIDEKIRKNDLTKREAVALTIGLWTPDEGERYGYTVYKGSRYGNSADYKYKTTDDGIRVKNTWHDKEMKFTWDEIENLTKEDIKGMKKELEPE